MRKVIALEFITLDGVIQGPGGPTEDTSDGFEFGGWVVPYSDEVMGKVMGEQTSQPFDLLLGRRTYDIWAPYWPKQDENGFFAGAANRATKYVASHSELEPEWRNSVRLSGDVAAEVRKLKQEDGPDLQVYGSANLLQTLFQHDLVDELWLKIYPVMLGRGKKLFADGTVPAAFELAESQTTTTGVIVANYRRAGEVQTGSF
jgi:dihydrofolate reductase